MKIDGVKIGGEGGFIYLYPRFRGSVRPERRRTFGRP